MNILPVGIYGPYPGAGFATNCFVVDNGKAKIVLDMGSGALSTLKKYCKLDEIDAFILSHLHFDHFCDILPLSYTGKERKVYCPAGPQEFYSLLKNHTSFRLGTIDKDSTISIGGMKITFSPVVHPIETYSIKISEGDKFFVYTSDTVWFDGLPQLVKGASLVLADCTSRARTPHMTPYEGAKLRELSGVKRIIGVHMNPDYDCQAECSLLGIEMVKEGKVIKAW
ncbi:MAG: MBL fold metallo-hydrolase [Clostridia bacterium]|nr:MBL fold metallo-hydrolase [Clostridia bacterium]